MKSALLLLCLVAVPAAAAAQDEDEDAAVVMVERAVAAYEEAEYEKAGAFFLEAYELSGLKNQLRNAAKAYQKGDALTEAEDLWQRYLDLTTLTAPERSEAEAQLALIAERRKAMAAEQEAERARRAAERARLAAQTSTTSAPPPAAPPPGNRTVVTERRLPIGPIVSFGVAGAAAIASIYLFVHSSAMLANLDDKLAIKEPNTNLITGIAQEDAVEELDQVNDERTAAAVVGGIAGAAAVVGTVWLLLDDGAPVPTASLTSEGAYFGLAGRF